MIDIYLGKASNPRPKDKLLHDAAVRGDDSAVCKALLDGADINAVDHSQRSVLSLAITGAKTADAPDRSFANAARLKTIGLLVKHPDISLLVLNAPENAMGGFTPLGYAVRLNAHDIVQVLLDSGAGAISVNGMDAHRATPLMYATRSNNPEVVRQLLAHGARPDYSDDSGHTPIWFALQHNQVLSLCENQVRKYRTVECQTGNRRNISSPARLAIDSLLVDDAPSCIPNGLGTSPNSNSLMKSIIYADLPLLRELLFPPFGSTSRPVLVNAPDSNGWSPIHYCTSSVLPSVEVLDTLYRAGADVGLFTKSGSLTPLHCLVRKERGSNALMGPMVAKELHEFVVHLCKDLLAPMRSCTTGRETCMHVAAEMGDSIVVLKALLECDVDGTVREMRNERGLTPFEVAKPEYKSTFAMQAETTRSSSPASLRTIRPSQLTPAPPTTPSVEMAKPEYKSTFAMQAETTRSSSPASLRTIRPSQLTPAPPTTHRVTLDSPSLTMSSLPHVSNPAIPLALSDAYCNTASTSPGPLHITTLAKSLISLLRLVQKYLSSSHNPLICDLDMLSVLLRTARERITALLEESRSRIGEASEEVKRGQEEWQRVDTFLDTVSQAYEHKIKELKTLEEDELEAAILTPTEPWCSRSRRGTSSSYESQATVVDSVNSYVTGPSPAVNYKQTLDGDSDQHSYLHFDGDDEHTHISARNDAVSTPMKIPWPAWSDQIDGSPISASYSYSTRFTPRMSPPSLDPRSRSSSKVSNQLHCSITQATSTPSDLVAAPSSSNGHASQGGGNSTRSLKSFRSMRELRNRPDYLSLMMSGNGGNHGSLNLRRPTAPLTGQLTPRPRAQTNASEKSIEYSKLRYKPTVKTRARAGSSHSATVMATVRDTVTAERTVTEDKIAIIGRKETLRAKLDNGGVEKARGHEQDEQPEGEKVKGSGLGTKTVKAWFRRRLNLKQTIATEAMSVQPQLPPVLARDAEAEGRSSLMTLCEPDCSGTSMEGKGRDLSEAFPYRAFAAALKDLARVDERMDDAEKIITAANGCVNQAEQVVEKALQTYEQTVLHYRAANTVEAGLEVFLSHRDSRSGSPAPMVDELQIEAPSTSALPSHPLSLDSSDHWFSNFSVSSLSLPHTRVDVGLSGVDGDISEAIGDEKGDTKVLHALLASKVDAVLEAAMKVEVMLEAATKEVEVNMAWLSVVKEVVRDVQKRVDMWVPKKQASLAKWQ